VPPAFDNLTLWQRVYDHLRDEIMGDRLPPGTELSEVALSRELAVSRGPIREAIGRLAAEGLVTVRPRRGAEVRSITPEELIDSYQVREALEVLAVRLAVPGITDAELADLDELVDRMSEHAKNGAVGDFFIANVAFHELRAERQFQAPGGIPPAGGRDRQIPGSDAGAARQPRRVGDRASRHPGGDQAAGCGQGRRAHLGPYPGSGATATRNRQCGRPACSGDGSRHVHGYGVTDTLPRGKGHL